MASETCPKCNHAMDDGRLSVTGGESATYVSDKQTGMMRQATRIQRARACTHCGYLELYLDTAELKKRIG